MDETEIIGERLHRPFPLTSVCRADLEEQGYDISKVDDDTMRELAEKMGEAIMDEFWIDLEIIADNLSIPKKKEHAIKTT